MFASIQKSCSATLALTTSSYNYAKKMADIQSIFSSDAMSWPQMRWEVVEALLASAPRAVAALSSIDDAASVAFLQFTSGSTSAPKGVIISHANLAHNLSLIVRELRASTDTVVVSWLPQYHDMGLIGSYLGALYCGGRGYYMSPFGFIKNPAVWVESISRYRGTHMQAPNFAYSLCARKFSTMRVPPSLDLSCVRHMINAAEPCDERSIDAFVETFTPHGLPADVIFPTYGLAEHTVFVCSGGTQRLRVDKVALESEQRASIAQPGAPDTTAVIGCGYPFRGQGVDVAIVDTDGTRLCEGRVGEIWVRSPSKAGGYWDLPEQSLEDFGATLREPDGSSAAPPADGGGAGSNRARCRAHLSSQSEARRRFAPRRIPPHRRPRVSVLGRAFHLWQDQGPHHRARAQPLPARPRENCRGRKRRAAARLLCSVHGGQPCESLHARPGKRASDSPPHPRSRSCSRRSPAFKATTRPSCSLLRCATTPPEDTLPSWTPSRRPFRQSTASR